MSKDYLPTHVNPFRFAENATRLSGSIPLKNMERLLSSVASEVGEVRVNMEFGIDRQKIRFLNTQLEASLCLQCQRCMESFDYEIQGSFLYGIVGSEEAANELPERFDPLIVLGEELVLQDLVEEELIVSLPIVAMHDPKDCKTRLPLTIAETSQEEAVKENPFKVIETLKVKPKQE